MSTAANAGPITESFSSIGVTVADGIGVDNNGLLNSTGNLTARDRGNPTFNGGTFTYADLYSSFITSSTVNSVMSIQLSGLTPDTQYQITFYTYDNNGTKTDSFTDITGGGSNPLGQIAWTSS